MKKWGRLRLILQPSYFILAPPGSRKCWRNQSGGRWCLKAPVNGFRKNPVTPLSNEVSGRSRNSESRTSSRLAMALEMDSPELPPCCQPNSRKFRLWLCERRLSRNSLAPKSCDAQRAVSGLLRRSGADDGEVPISDALR